MSRKRPHARHRAPRPPIPRHRAPVAVRGRPRVSGWVWPAAIGVLLSGVLLVVAVRADSGQSGSSSGATPATLLAPVDTSATGASVDGIQCGSHEEALFHIHAHVAVMVNGAARGIPRGVGIAPPRQEEQTSSGPYVVSGSCFYWLHTHTADGIIHIESPVQRSFTLGDFFDIWGQPLSTAQVGPARGTVTVYLNGARFTGDPRSVPLTAHAVIQLDVGADTPPAPFDFPGRL